MFSILKILALRYSVSANSPIQKQMKEKLVEFQKNRDINIIKKYKLSATVSSGLQFCCYHYKILTFLSHLKYRLTMSQCVRTYLLKDVLINLNMRQFTEQCKLQSQKLPN